MLLFMPLHTKWCSYSGPLYYVVFIQTFGSYFVNVMARHYSFRIKPHDFYKGIYSMTSLFTNENACTAVHASSRKMTPVFRVLVLRQIHSNIRFAFWYKSKAGMLFEKVYLQIISSVVSKGTALKAEPLAAFFARDNATHGRRPAGNPTQAHPHATTTKLRRRRTDSIARLQRRQCAHTLLTKAQ